MPRQLSEAKLQAIADRVNRDGREIAGLVLHRADGSPDIAIAILGVASGRIIDSIEPERRNEVLRNYLESFE